MAECPYCGKPLEEHSLADPYLGIPLRICESAPPDALVVVMGDGGGDG